MTDRRHPSWLVVAGVAGVALVAGAVGIGFIAIAGPGPAPITEPPVPIHRSPVAGPTELAPSPTASGVTPPAQSVEADGPIDPSWCGPLALTLTSAGGDAGLGHREAQYRATNTGSTTCVLDGYPDVAIADAAGSEVPLRITHGGGFMTTDPGAAVVTLVPGASAVAQFGWDATDGRTQIGSVSIAAYPGLIRTVLPAQWDMTSDTVLAVTAWGEDVPDLDPTA